MISLSLWYLLKPVFIYLFGTCLCVCMFGCVCMYVWMCVCVYTGVYARVPLHAGQKLMLGSFSVTVYHILWDGLLWNPELDSSASQASQQTHRIPSPHLLSAGITNTYHYSQHCMWVLGTWTQILILCGQHFTHWAIPPAPSFDFIRIREDAT